MSLASTTAEILLQYEFEAGSKFGGNELAETIRLNWRDDAKTICPDSSAYFIKGSAGAGNWAAVPWLGFFDELVTRSATEGYYVVLLLNTRDKRAYLSLNQGTTALYREFGESAGRDVLSRRASDMRARISEFEKSMTTREISLGSDNSLPLGYEAGHILGFGYSIDELSDSSLSRDLRISFKAYQALIRRGGSTPLDVMMAEAGSKSVVESKRYALSRRIERSNSIRKEVLRARGYSCEGCGLKDCDYSSTSPTLSSLLEVHHCTPLNQLAEGEEKLYRIPKDFFVLCPSCHSAIHQQHDVGDLQELRKRLRFSIARSII